MKNLLLKVSIKLAMIVDLYFQFITNKNNYVVLTVISEILNLGRIYPAVLACKVVVDMHREYMKMVL